ncbi:Nramp family divalent metal transporter [Haloarchaeobius sp. HME9146]|uniref:Nramp family divalent metal transporter n=1 Tax=Haloarchaeobius sp. HME9146 TaxID=2978732 RepID=UPI0021C1E4C2|nr:Nramp family divalent metal transporter [Haloarchaeobius sp. HME9146]MCT9097817.1 Nramp family divalent metal transporter [Haloarchaeobius sp. HME9146]
MAMEREQEAVDAAVDEEPEVYASPEEGREYRASAYAPTAYDNLEVAPEDEEHPDPGEGDSYRLVDLPRVPKLTHVLGPSAIMLGASLGSGETIFWPLLVAQNGWSIYWAFWVGVLTHFVINTEIQRWTLATGESIFRAFERVHRGWPILFLILGFVSFGWPGWAATAAKVGATGLGIESTFTLFGYDFLGWKAYGILLMLLIWGSYQLTPLMYNVVERVTAVLVASSVLCAMGLFVLVGDPGELTNIPLGAVSIGTLPADEDVAVFLGGLAYAGAGGYLNLSQSLWVREKGYGMGRYQGRVLNPIVGDEPEIIHRDGFSFEATVENMRRWRGWWRLAQLEHLVTFVLGVLVTATAMMAIAATYVTATDAGGVEMWLTGVAPNLPPLAGALLYGVLFLALFTTEYAIVESVVRNSADVIYESVGRERGWSLPRIFWYLLTAFAGWGILILTLPIPIEQPFGLLLTAAAMSGAMMWPYTALTLLINTRRLPEHTQPGWPRIIAMWWATAFFGYFSVLLVGNTFEQLLGLSVFRVTIGVTGSAPGGLALFVVLAITQVYVMSASAKAKWRAEETVENAGEADGLFS